MERVGFGRRFAAAILDGIFLFILVTIGVVIYAAVGGSRLALDAQRALGVPVTWNSVASEELWMQYERRAEEMVAGMERRVREEFTDEQAEFIGRTLAESFERYFVPERFSLQFFLNLDEDQLDRMVDGAFDSVLAAGRSDIDAAEVNELRREVKVMMDEFALGTIVPRAISFALWLAFLPAIIVLVYGLAEGVFGRTLGKLATGIAVRRDDGDRAYAGATMLRFAVKYSPLLLVVPGLLLRSPALLAGGAVAVAVVLVGALPMLGSERRAVHDYISGTAVFKVGRGENWS